MWTFAMNNMNPKKAETLKKPVDTSSQTHVNMCVHHFEKVAHVGTYIQWPILSDHVQLHT